MLDPSGNIHSIVRQHAKTHLTGAYWDALAVLPALVPDGPVSILGLAGGTIAWLLQELYPGRQMHGWELDPAVVEVAQQHMGLQRLQDSGRLVVHVGDALAPSAAVPGGFAGTIVDLFAEGELIHELLEASAWAGIRQRLAPGGRVIVNLGPAPMQGMPPAQVARTLTAMAALAEAFDGHLVCCSFSLNDTANMLAISGPPPTAEDWARVPAVLKQFATGGRFVGWETFAAFKESKASSFFNW